MYFDIDHTASYVLKKEYDKLKEVNIKLEYELKKMRKTAEEAKQKAIDYTIASLISSMLGFFGCFTAVFFLTCTYVLQLKIAEANLRHLDEQRRSAEEKVRLLEESPGPVDLKQANLFSEEEAKTNPSK